MKHIDDRVALVVTVLLICFALPSHAEDFKMPPKKIRKYIKIACKWFPAISEKEITIILWKENRYRNINSKETYGYSYGLGSITRDAAWDVCTNYKIIPHKLSDRQFNIIMVAGYLNLLRNKYGLSKDKSIMAYNIGIRKAKKYKTTKYLKGYKYWSKQYDKLLKKEK